LLIVDYILIGGELVLNCCYENLKWNTKWAIFSLPAMVMSIGLNDRDVLKTSAVGDHPMVLKKHEKT